MSGDRELSLADLDGTVHTIAALWEGMPYAEKKFLSRDFTDALDVLIEHINTPVTDDLGPVEPPHWRAEALGFASRSWPAACDVGQNVADHARSVLRVAEAYERYLTDGTVPPAPEGRETLEAPPTPVAGREATRDTPTALRSAVLNAALAWVDEAHLENTVGLDNWRNWADGHDVTLIDAVLAYRGLPPLERKLP